MSTRSANIPYAFCSTPGFSETMPIVPIRPVCKKSGVPALYIVRSVSLGNAQGLCLPNGAAAVKPRCITAITTLAVWIAVIRNG